MDPLNRITDLHYHAAKNVDRITRYKDPPANIPAGGPQLHLRHGSQQPPDQRRLTTTDPRGFASRSSYDRLGRLTIDIW